MLAVLTEEQESLADTVKSLGSAVGVGNPQDLDGFDHDRAWKALVATDVLSLRVRDEGAPLGSGVDAMVVASGLGALLSPAPFRWVTLAVELLEAAGADAALIEEVAEGRTLPGLALDRSLVRLARVDELESAVVVGGSGVDFVLASRPAGAEMQIVRTTAGTLVAREGCTDLTTFLWDSPSTSEASPEDLGMPLSCDAMSRWTALALTLVSADCAGTLRAALDGVIEYTKVRVAYGVPIGSFQALQHITADAFASCEAAVTNNNYASWAIDELEPEEALLAARTAKAWVASVARDVSEAVMQLYGGIGQTWEHIAHVHARRAMLNTVLFGDENHQLDQIFEMRKGA